MRKEERKKGYAGDEVDIVALDVAEHEDFEFAEEVQRELVDRVAENRLLHPENRLLHQQHVAPRLLDLLAHLRVSEPPQSAR